MAVLSDVGTIIEVTPGEKIFYRTSEEECEYLDDLTPLRFRVEGRLEAGQIFYGLFGPVTEGPERYLNLLCNIMVRNDGSDWRKSQRCMANFKVGRTKAKRNYEFDFRHPEGTIVYGFPVIGRFGIIEVVDEHPRPRGHYSYSDVVWASGVVREYPESKEGDSAES